MSPPPIHNETPDKKPSQVVASTNNKRKQDLSTSVRELGQRARQRLEEERSKRPEIVVLKQPAPLPPTRQPKSAPKLVSAVAAQPKGPAPDSAPKEKSSVLRVDGLPEQCTPEMIRRFFSGFEPDRIVILPTLDLEFIEWGETEVPTERVLVKFPSAPIAVAASQRSYEHIFQDDEKFAIKLSLVPKHTGIYLLQNLAIDGVSGEHLSATRERIESNTQSRILHLLWTLAIRELNIDAQEWLDNTSYPWKRSLSDFYDNLVDIEDYRGRLTKELNHIERAGGMLQVQAGDPQLLLSDATVRFFHTACNQLCKQIETASNLILMARYESQRPSE
jgi:hypothetical protein